MKRKTRFALAAMFDNLVPVELRNVSIASFYPTERLIQKLIIGIEAVQSGSGDPSPDNVRPISGFTGLNVYGTGKNIVHVTFADSTANQVTFTNNGDGTVTVDGTASAFAGKSLAASASDDLYLKAGVTYHLSGGGDGVNFYLYKNGVGVLRTDVGNGANYTPSEDISYVVPYLSVSAGVSVDNLIVKPMVEIEEETTEWQEYVGTTLPVSWQSEAGTVYGGTLDVITGLLTVTHGIVDLGDYDWTYYTGGTNPIFYTTVTGTRQYSNGDMPNAISSMYKVRISQSRSNFARYALDGEFTFLSTTESLAIRNSDYTSAAAFKTAMSGQTVVYELATPLAYQLTPQQIATIRPGINNVWCDTGPVIELIS